MTRVLVLNATYAPLNVVTVRRAVALLLSEKAEVLEFGDGVLRSEFLALDSPAVIRLVRYVKVPYGYRKRVTRRAVLARDNGLCQFCGAAATTVDHLVPKSHGGKLEWSNVVAACVSCNRRKGNRLVDEVGMRLRSEPGRPRRDVFAFVAVRVPPESWGPYLA